MASPDAPPARKPYDLSTAAHDYSPWNGPPKRTILICSHPRSGSTLLGEAITFAGGHGCPLEYFHVGFRPSLAERWGAFEPDAYVAAVRRYRTDVDGTLAVKLFWRDMQDLAAERDPGLAARLSLPPRDTPAETYEALVALLAPIFPAPRFVHLVRTDRARQAISAAAATDTRLWRSIPGVGEQDAVAEPSYDYERITDLIALSDFSHGHWRNFFAAARVVPHRLSYERLAADYERSVAEVFAHLGIDATPPAIRMRRQYDERSERMLVRYLRERATREAA